LFHHFCNTFHHSTKVQAVLVFASDNCYIFNFEPYFYIVWI
jgi:hypothetical protein